MEIIRFDNDPEIIIVLSSSESNPFFNKRSDQENPRFFIKYKLFLFIAFGKKTLIINLPPQVFVFDFNKF